MSGAGDRDPSPAAPDLPVSRLEVRDGDEGIFGRDGSGVLQLNDDMRGSRGLDPAMTIGDTGAGNSSIVAGGPFPSASLEEEFLVLVAELLPPLGLRTT